MRSITSRVVACLLASAFLGCGSPERTAEEVSRAPSGAVKKLTAVEINSLFQGTKAVPYGSIYEVTGVVRRVNVRTPPQESKGQEELTVQLYLPDYAAVVITCRFPLTQKGKVVSWAAGQEVTVRGQLWAGPLQLLGGTNRSVLHLDGCLPVEGKNG